MRQVTRRCSSLKKMRLMALDPTYVDTGMRRANSDEELGNALLLKGELAQAEQHRRGALAMREKFIRRTMKTKTC